MRAALRPAGVFLLTFAIYAAIAGPRLLGPSRDNHFSHLAAAWLSGRLDLPGPPPHRNDWGRVTTYELDGGRRVEGIRCRTRACTKDTPRGHVAVVTLDGRVETIPRRAIRRRTTRTYVTFPPGPAVLLLPLVALFGLATPDVLVCALVGALGPALLVLGLDRLRPPDTGLDPPHLVLAAALGLGSPLAFVAPAGGVWFLAQALAVACSVVAIPGALGAHRPWVVGVALALLLATRPTVAVGVAVFIGLLALRNRPPRSVLAATFLPALVVGLALAAHNVARFGDPFEFGHRFLDVVWQPRIQTHGLFSLRYLPRNLHAMFLLLPKVEGHTIRISIHGASLLLACPWVLGAFGRHQRYEGRLSLLAGAVAAAIFPLLYQNTGQVQASPRFALDFLPFVLVHLARTTIPRRPVFWGLVGLSAVYGLATGILFVRAPGRLFVPSLWPYEHGP